MSVAWPGIPHWPDEPVSEVYGFVLPDMELDLSKVASIFRETGSGVSVGEYQTNDEVNFRHRPVVSQVVAAFAENWMVRVYLKVGVLGDAQQMADHCFRNHPQAAEIGTCDRLVDILVADPDCSVAAFDCLDTAREWLKGQPGVIVLHPDSGEPL
jgi:hypothetical protein